MATISTRPFAVLTGGSRGIGYELARQFAQNGFDLLIVADSELVQKAAADLQSLGASVQPVQVNLAEIEGTQQLINAIEATGRPVDAVAINAGVGVSGRFFRDGPCG
jgi:short-subunit dehydrogenase